MDRIVYKSKRTFANAAELSEQGKARYENEMNDKEKAEFKSQYYDYEKQPNLFKLNKFAGKNDFLIVHMNTTGIKAKDHEITQFAGILLSYDKTMHCYKEKERCDVTLSVSKEAIEKLREDIANKKFDPLEYAGIDSIKYLEGIGILSKTDGWKKIQQFLSPYANDLTVIKVGYNKEFINDFCQKEKLDYRANYDLCNAVNEYNGAKLAAGEPPMFTGKASIRNIGEQFQMSAKSAMDVVLIEAKVLGRLMERELEKCAPMVAIQSMEKETVAQKEENPTVSALFGVQKVERNVERAKPAVAKTVLPVKEPANATVEPPKQFEHGTRPPQESMESKPFQKPVKKPSESAKNFERATNGIDEKLDQLLEIFQKQEEQRNLVLDVLQKILEAEGERIEQMKNILERNGLKPPFEKKKPQNWTITVGRLEDGEIKEINPKDEIGEYSER